MSKLVGMFYALEPEVVSNSPGRKTVRAVTHEILEMLPEGRLLAQPSSIWISWDRDYGHDLDCCTVRYERHTRLEVRSVAELPTALCHAPDYSYQFFNAAACMASLLGCDARYLQEDLCPELTAAIARRKLRLKSKS